MSNEDDELLEDAGEEGEEEEDEGNEEPALVPRSLKDNEVRDKQLLLAERSVEVLDLEKKRRRIVKAINTSINAAKEDIRTLATQVQTRVEMVPAQGDLPGVPASGKKRRRKRK